MRSVYCVMEMSVMLLLLMPLIAAMALRDEHRPHPDTVSLEHRIRLPTERQASKTIPLRKSTSDMLLQSLLMQARNAQASLRRRRAPSKGCQFGTCQMHNLASTLYRMGQTNNKDQSKGAGDPNGYGR
ncbi:hypothetical protein HF521_020316 [Silurus meridionalis]|uniref:Uncharacterized protein n=1 Tax=Silurus meridionalis TaxID=175797 RepID=A0A8T0BHZ3_SILME|nr:hypothetical protein HF521_020316 [Silurus meridionalis]